LGASWRKENIMSMSAKAIESAIAMNDKIVSQSEKISELEKELFEFRKRAKAAIDLSGGPDAKWALDELQNLLDFGA
jgi:hypothetical protein